MSVFDKISDVFNKVDYSQPIVGVTLDGFILRIVTFKFNLDVKKLESNLKKNYNLSNSSVDPNIQLKCFAQDFERHRINLIKQVLNEIKTNPYYMTVPFLSIFFMGDLEDVNDTNKNYSGNYGWVNSNEIQRGDYNIYLNIPNLTLVDDINHKYLINEPKLIEALRHEQQHIIHEIKNKVFTNADFVTLNLLKSLKRDDSELVRGLDNLSNSFSYRAYFIYIRDLISSIMRKIHTDGFATFFSDEHQYCYLLDSWKNKHNEVRPITKSIQTGLMDILDTFYPDDSMSGLVKEELIKQIGSLLKQSYNTYELGSYMVYTIVFLGKKSYQEVLQMSVYQFFDEYEKAIISYGENPLVSLNSGKGILDFNRLLGVLSFIVTKQQHFSKSKSQQSF